VTGSIGISFYPRDGEDYESLMKNADLSMYYAKDNGRNNYRIFDEEMNRHVINRMQLDTALRDALELDEFHLAYQPLVDLSSNRTVGLEALLRWESHILGSVSPVDFIGMAEETGLIVDIGQWALERACTQLLAWHKKGLNRLSVAVNISGRQFRQTRLKDIVKELLEKTQLPPEFLELELTESLLVEDVEHAVKTMYELKDMGIKLVIDDFGTGYSSLSYLKQFPVDKLKIDRSFITEIVSINSDAAIARAIINLGHSLKLEVLAEGIETELQKEFLIKHGCDFAQGYYFSRPERADVIAGYLKKTS
jgi:EAL domain-containing protein (putative c-di-GMP-specific phosphodiesterase class I)